MPRCRYYAMPLPLSAMLPHVAAALRYVYFSLTLNFDDARTPLTPLRRLPRHCFSPRYADCRHAMLFRHFRLRHFLRLRHIFFAFRHIVLAFATFAAMLSLSIADIFVFIIYVYAMPLI